MANKKNQKNYRDKKSTKKNDTTRCDSKQNASGKSVDTANFAEKAVAGGQEPEWYLRNPNLINAVTSIPYMTQYGKVNNLGEGWNEDVYKWSNFSAPSVMVLRSLPTPGCTYDNSSGIMNVVNGLFQYVRKNLSTYASYAPADLFMYLWHITNTYALYIHIRRLFALANIYSADNLYLPRSIAMATYGWTKDNFEDFVAGYANYRSRFNNLILAGNRLYLPTDFSVTSRYLQIYGNVFTDSDVGIKSQLYTFTPQFIYCFSDTSSDQGSICIPKQIFGLSIKGLLDTFQFMVDTFQNSDSMMSMAGDLRRAFLDHNNWGMAYIDEAIAVVPKFEPYVNLQIMNSDILIPLVSNNLGGNTDWADPNSIAYTWTVHQDVDTNRVIFQPKFKKGAGAFSIQDALLNPHKAFLNMPMTQPGVQDTAEATRLKTTWVNTNDSAIMTSCGADIILEAEVFSGVDAVSGTPYRSVVDVSANPGELGLNLMFNWAPVQYVHSADPSSDGLTPICDYMNFTTISSELMANINNIIMTSMWTQNGITTV